MCESSRGSTAISSLLNVLLLKPMSPHEDIRYLAGSPYRPELLAALRAEDLRPAELTERIDVTRTTVQRILSGFRERNWILKTDRTYRTTVTGERVLDAYEALEDEVERAEAYGVLAANAEEIAVALAPELFTATTATVATGKNPFGPIERYFAVCETVENQVRQVAPIVSTEAVEMVDAFLANGVTVQLIVDSDLYETMQLQFPGALQAWRADPLIALSVQGEPIDYGLSLLDETVVAASVDKGLNLEILVEGTDPTLRETTVSLFERMWADATPIDELGADEAADD